MLTIRVPEERHYFEHVLIPFYDPWWMSTFRIETQHDAGVFLEAQQQWCWYSLIWKNFQSSTQIITCSLDTTIFADRYAEFILSAAQADGIHISFEFLFDDERICSFSETVRGIEPYEFHAKLSTSDAHGIIKKIILRFTLPIHSQGTVVLNWIAGKVKDHIFAAKARDDISSWILPEEQRGPIKFMRGLLFSEEDLEIVRRKKSLAGWAEHFYLLESEAEKFLQRVPERDFGDYLPNGDVRYVRGKDIGKTPYHWEALVLAFVGLVNKDSRCINHALRYLICMLRCPNWCDNLMQYSPDGVWTPRAFQEEMTATSVSILVDWLYFALAPQTISLAYRAIWDRGISPVRRDLIQYDYMHTMNQGIVFNRACILGGLILEYFWPRMKNEVDYAYRQALEITARYLRKDGSAPEGLGYFCQMSTGLIWSVIAYGRARNTDWRTELKKLFCKADNFVSALCYNQNEGLYHPVADCRLERLCGDVVPVLAQLFPTSTFSRALGACLKSGSVYALTGTLSKSGGMIGMVYGPESVFDTSQDKKSSYDLKDGGILSFRSRTAPQINLCLMGGEGERSHAHADLGNFMLALNGRKLFIDRGMVNYWKNETMFLKETSAHNCLTPIVDGHYVSQAAVECSHVATSIGMRKMHAEYDISKSFPAIFDSYIRKFDFDLHKQILVSDIVKFVTHGQVAFHLQSVCKPEINGMFLTFTLDTISVHVHFPWAESLTVDTDNLSFNGETVYHCIALSEDIKEKILATEILIH